MTRFSERESRHLSQTPHITAALTKFAGRERGRVELDDDRAAAYVPSADQSVRRVTTPPQVRPQDILEPINIPVLPVRSEHKPQPILNDAIVCWNELIQSGQNPSRNNLQQALIAKGFDCKENWARKFYEDIKEMLKEQPEGSVGE